jgi:hypothetical protein
MNKDNFYRYHKFDNNRGGVNPDIFMSKIKALGHSIKRNGYGINWYKFTTDCNEEKCDKVLKELL